MNIIIPTKEKELLQLNTNKYSGNVWGSKNMDLQQGDMRLSPRFLIGDTSYDDEYFGLPVAITNFGSSTVVVTHDSSLTSSDFTTWTRLRDGGPPTVYPVSDFTSDVAIFNDKIYISNEENISEVYPESLVDNIWWTNTVGGAALNDDYAHPLCVGFNNLMVVGDGNVVRGTNIRDDYFAELVKIPDKYAILWIVSASDRYWIGTMKLNNSDGGVSVFSWDGASDNFNYQYTLNANVVYAGVLLDDVLHITTDNGDLLKFNGSGFTKIASFPFYHTNFKLRGSQTHVSQPIHRNGMTVVGDEIYIAISSWIDSIGGTFKLLENMPSGVWKYSKDNGLYHYGSLSMSEVDGIVDYAQDYTLRMGAIKSLAKDTDFGGQTILAGSNFFKTSSTAYLLNYLEYQDQSASVFQANRGYVITPRLEAKEILETWDKLFIKSENKTGGSIIVKYRIEEEFDWDAQGTWASTTSFTSTDTNCSELAEGDEIEILNGVGGGIITTIKTISFTTPTYTITTDDTIASITATDNFYFKPNNFTLLDTISATDTGVKELPINLDSQWIQFRLEIRSGGDTPIIREVALKSTIKTQYEQ